MSTLTETAHAGEFIASKANVTLSMEQGTLKSGNNLVAGAVCGFIPSGTSASAAKSGGNTGNGTFVLDGSTPILPGAKEGVYTLRCIAAATNGGTFRLEDPDGEVIGEVAIAGGAGGTAAVSEQIKGVLTDGSADFAVGDGFDITISALTGKYSVLNPAGTDGSQTAIAIIYDNIDATSADKRATFFRREGEVNGNLLTWPGGISAANKAIAKANLARLSNIFVR